jgi:tetratricopeptide (TPR) repeat protein
MKQLNQSDPAYINAMTEFMEGDWKAAEKSFLALKESYPESSFVRLNLGNIYYSMGMLNKSIESYEEALEIEPEWGVAYYKIGVTYFRAGKLIKSLDAFNKVLELRNQSHAMASYFVGLINFFLGRDEVSDTAFTQFHDIAPESMIANYFLAEIKIKKNRFNEAIALLEELLEETPNLSEAWYMLGQAFYGLHRNTDAIKAFRKVLEINPEDSRAKTKLTLMTDVEW